jgi:hypothetical protein
MRIATGPLLHGMVQGKIRKSIAQEQPELEKHTRHLNEDLLEHLEHKFDELIFQMKSFGTKQGDMVLDIDSGNSELTGRLEHNLGVIKELMNDIPKLITMMNTTLEAINDQNEEMADTLKTIHKELVTLNKKLTKR